MSYLRRFAALALGAGCATILSAQPAKPPKEPARIDISVSPEAVAAGADATVIVQIVPKDGIKVNRYPKIKLEVPAQPGLVAEARAEVGNDRPPPPDQMDTNYYKSVDPVELRLRVDGSATSGTHEVPGRLTYFYCVAASGFCAPHRMDVTIPVAVR